MKIVEITISTIVTGIFKKKITFEIKYENTIEYAYSLSDLVFILLHKFNVDIAELRFLLYKLEHTYYKIK